LCRSLLRRKFEGANDPLRHDHDLNTIPDEGRSPELSLTGGQKGYLTYAGAHRSVSDHGKVPLQLRRAGCPASGVQQLPVPRDLHLDASVAIIAELAGEGPAVFLDGPELFAGSQLPRRDFAVGRVEGRVAHRRSLFPCSDSHHDVFFIDGNMAREGRGA
jgi:hypothetical protein